MHLFYRAILRLYPAEYRKVFAAEMIAAFDQATMDSRKQRALNFVWFGTREFAGLLKGLFSEWTAKWAAQHA